MIPYVLGGAGVAHLSPTAKFTFASGPMPDGSTPDVGTDVTSVLASSGSFAAPHGIAVDSRGDIYVAEVTWTFAESRGRVPAGCHTFQKFTLKG